VRVAGCNPFVIALRTVHSSLEDRVGGLAAEMAFFALLSLIPAIVALGAGLGGIQGIVGAEAVAEGRAAAIDALRVAFSPRMTRDVLEPLIDGLIDADRGGIAVSGILAALWLASRVFTATIRALDLAYNVAERRGLIVQRVLAVAFALCAVVVVTLTLVLSVVGPLLGTGREIADVLGMGELFARMWSIARWPMVFAIAVAFFTFVYRYGPNLDNRWRDCVPGAVLGVTLWLLAAVGFRIYLATFGEPGAQFVTGDEEQQVAVLGQVVGAIVAAILWVYLSGLALLVGGELNSEVTRARCAG
jgi:membrane protein